MSTDIIRPYVFASGNVALTTSKHVAEYYKKRHDNVLRAIGDILSTEGVPAHFFTASSYIDEGGRTHPLYNMGRDGAMLLTMGFRGEMPLRHNVAFIQAFNTMERKLRQSIQRLPTISGAYVKAMSDMMNRVFELCPNLSAPVRQSVAMQFCEKVGVNVPAPVVESKLYSAADIADELHLTVQKMARDDRYKTLKGLEGYGLHTLFNDASGTPRSTWQWSEAGRRALLRTFGVDDELQELLS